MKNNKVKKINKIDNKFMPYKHFRISSCMFNKWSNQEIRYDEIIGIIRRFRINRVPNKYN